MTPPTTTIAMMRMHNRPLRITTALERFRFFLSPDAMASPLDGSLSNAICLNEAGKTRTQVQPKLGESQQRSWCRSGQVHGVIPATAEIDYATLRKISEALVPPKPKEFESATSICFFSGTFGTRLIGVSTDGFSRFNVGGATLSRIASSEKIASTEPAAPSRCPMADFVDDIAAFGAASPSSRVTAPNSISSPSGVEVPCALM